MPFTGAEALWECLVREGVSIVWAYPGGAALPLFDALAKYPQIHHVLVRHEQAAAHAADGYARASGRVGVCVVTSGPGATNLVTGIATAIMDSVPLVALTAQVADSVIGTDAFQEINITGITLPITKHNYLVRKSEDLVPVLREAFFLARTGRPGPVLVDLPKDILIGPCEFRYPERVSRPGYRPVVRSAPYQIQRAAQAILQASRPVVLAGHGIHVAGAWEELRQFAERINAPVVSTLLGLSSLPADHPLFLGMAGMHGVAWANLAAQNADLLIALGMRMDDRFTGSLPHFAPGAKLLHVDIDPAEISKRVPATVPMVGDVRLVLEGLIAALPELNHRDWLAQIDAWHTRHPLDVHARGPLPPQEVIRALHRATGGDGFLVSDVGQHQMWVAQHYGFRRLNSFFTSGGLGTMGYSLPASMGVQAAHPNEAVWVVVGDGGFQMNLQELATIVQEQLPIKIVIMNNGYLGMVRQWQELFHGARYIGTPISGPDFVKLAASYGIQALQVSATAGLEAAFASARESSGPFLLDCRVEQDENVYPMVQPGTSNTDFVEDPRGRAQET
ncbi:MAG TPA: biosynthetic-type acetolactate synthase large subunit [Acidobacteriota bacterium]|nr:biosynthetic-type acetolactate synthase large subunit [Acidobacteriota bacterium]